jgi:hypothetical protein
VVAGIVLAKFSKTYNVTLRRVRATIVTVGEQLVLPIVNVCLFSCHSYSGCRSHVFCDVLCCRLCPVRLCHVLCCRLWPCPALPCTMLSSVALSGSAMYCVVVCGPVRLCHVFFPQYPINGTVFGGGANVTEHKICVSNFSTTLV